MEKLNRIAEHGDYLLVQVPEDAHSFEVYENNVIGGYCIMYLRGNPDYACEYSPNLPPGNYSIVGKGNELKWSDWVGIVEKENDESESLNCWWYKDYEKNEIMTKNAVKSGLSLIRSKGLSPEITLIIKKENNVTDKNNS